jgi:Zn-dependent metalloprotease
MRRTILPPYLLTRLAEADPERLSAARQAARRALRDQGPLIHDRRRPGAAADEAARAERDPSGIHRTISDAGNLGATYALFSEVYGRESLDDRGLPLLATVHYGEEYDNAFWDGTRMVFGDGDGEVFAPFTRSLTVIGHELTHGVTELTLGLVYQGQSGALNESISDVFGVLVEQHALGQAADEATWLVGAELFLDRSTGLALRSMRAPGTAYDDDVLGKDPQPGHMDDYVETEDDNGGVHINSGIPNRAFFLAATAIGGEAWEGAGRVWYDVIESGAVRADADFAAFARATVEAASARYGEGASEVAAVQAAWEGVGIEV